MPPPRIFLLSPVNCAGKRARQLMSDAAQFTLARELRETGAQLGDVFTFCSELYFRGKVAYARRFARPPNAVDPLVGSGVLVITPNAGLLAADEPVTLDVMREFATEQIDASNAGYRLPLERDARALLDCIGPDCEVVLLGSIASGKYVDVLLPIFGVRLLFPKDFVGRGDMSRGGLMLRSVDSGQELDYEPIAMAVRHGQRPPKLERIVAARRPRPNPRA